MNNKVSGISLGVTTLILCACGALAQAPPGGGFPPPPGQGFGQPGGPPQGFGQGGPGGRPDFQRPPGMGRGGPGGPNFEMGRRVARISALRALHESGYSADDYTHAATALKALVKAEKELQSSAERALDEELKALLKAEPGKPLPSGGGAVNLRTRGDQFEALQRDVWSKLEQAIGRPKSMTLRAILGSDDPMGQPGPGGRGFGQPGGGGRRGSGGPPELQQAQPPVLGGPGGGPAPQGRGGQGFGQGRGFGGDGFGQRPRGDSGFGPPMGQGAFRPGPMISLSDLAELLEQKLAALKRG